MDSTVNINHILNEIEKLDKKDKIQLMSGIINLIKKEEKHKASSASITQLKGLGKELWQKTDTQAYLTSERESWD